MTISYPLCTTPIPHFVSTCYIQAEFQHLLADDKHDDLGRMYQLVSRIPDGLTELRTLLEDHITQQGLSAIEREGESAHNDPKVLKPIY